MKHFIVLAVKLAMIALIAEIILGAYTGLRIEDILLVALAITVITYLIGDLLILSVFNNTVAAVADAGISWLIIYLSGYVWPDRIVPLISALSAAAVIGAGEIFIHMYLERKWIVLPGGMQ